MSGVTGIQGWQGTMGGAGNLGPQGIPGQNGPVGAPGPYGVTGPTGISGGTGTQLYGNGSLVQNATCSAALGAGNTVVEFNAKNPALNGSNRSTTISGQYDSTGINYYGLPLSFDASTGSFITIPIGKYYITASLPATLVSQIIAITLSSYSGGLYTDIAYSTPATANGVCHLQYVYCPTVDTVVSIRYSPVGGPCSLADSKPHINLSIVKIW